MLNGSSSVSAEYSVLTSFTTKVVSESGFKTFSVNVIFSSTVVCLNSCCGFAKISLKTFFFSGKTACLSAVLSLSADFTE